MSMKKTAQSGFTLIETLVAVTILALAVSGPLVAASRAVAVAGLSRDKLIASYLAQEGVEYVRAMRDGEYLQLYSVGDTDDAWNNFLNGSDSSSIAQCRTATCTLDPAKAMGTNTNGTVSLQPCGGATGSSCLPLYPNANGVYSREVNTDYKGTLFTRTVQVLDIPGTSDSPTVYPEKKVVSIVSWRTHGSTHSVTITDHLTLWQ